MGKEQNSVTTDDIDIDFPDDKVPVVLEMIRKDENSWSGKLRKINNTELLIDLKLDVVPIKSPPYRAGTETRELEGAEIDKQLKSGIIEPALYEWGAPVLFVPKKDGKLLFCIDNIKLNSMTVTDIYPFSHMNEWIDTLGEALHHPGCVFRLLAVSNPPTRPT